LFKRARISLNSEKRLAEYGLCSGFNFQLFLHLDPTGPRYVSVFM